MDRADEFQIVGLKKAEKPVYTAKKTESRLPYASFVILVIIAAGCMLYDVFSGRDPSYMNLMSYSKAPCR